MLPTTIQIGAQTWHIILSDDLDDGLDGECIPTKYTIKINPFLSDDRKRETLLHEAIHACVAYVGLSDDKPHTEDEFVDAITSTLHSLLVQNELY